MTKFSLYSPILIISMGMTPIAYSQEIYSTTPTNTSITAYQDGHFYLGGRAGWTAFEDACGDNTLDCNDDAFGYGIYGGYQFNSWFALEAGFSDYGKSSARYPSEKVSADVKGAEIGIKFTLPVTERLGLYTRLGGAYQDIDKHNSLLADEVSSHNWNAFASLGASYRLSQRWSLRAEYQLIDGIGDSNTQQADMHFTSLGLTYHFGQRTVSTNQSTPATTVTPTPIAAPVESITPVHKEVVKEWHTVSLSAQSLFEFDSAQMKNSSELTSLINKLNENKGKSIRIVGHTDSVGSEAYNQKLSEQRAQAVAIYLVNQGINDSLIAIEGRGENAPVADNHTAEGRAKNRRVEVMFEIAEQHIIESSEDQ